MSSSSFPCRAALPLWLWLLLFALFFLLDFEIFAYSFWRRCVHSTVFPLLLLLLAGTTAGIAAGTVAGAAIGTAARIIDTGLVSEIWLSLLLGPSIIKKTLASFLTIRSILFTAVDRVCGGNSSSRGHSSPYKYRSQDEQSFPIFQNSLRSLSRSNTAPFVKLTPSSLRQAGSVLP